MKIFHCLGNYFPDPVGGTEIYVNALCLKLKEDGFEVAVIKPSFLKTPAAYSINRIPVWEYHETSSPTVEMQMGLHAPDGLENFRQLLLREKPDVVHFHETAGSTGITIFHVKAAADLGFAVVATFHLTGNICMSDSFLFKDLHPCAGIINTHQCSVCMLHKKGLPAGAPEVLTWLGSRFQTKLVTNGIRKALNYPLYVRKHKENLSILDESCSAVFVLSKWYRHLLIKNGYEKKKIIDLPPSVSSVVSRKDWKRETMKSQSVVRFIYSGRIASIKGLHIALEAFSNLEQKNWQFDIYGHAGEQDYVRDCKKMAAGNPRINWQGPMEHKALLSALPFYHALLFPSLAQETMGLSMLEAMASKVPVIGSSIWTVNENIEHGKNGLIFERGDAKNLQQIISEVLNNPSVLPFLAGNISDVDNMASSVKSVGATYRAVCFLQNISE